MLAKMNQKKKGNTRDTTVTLYQRRRNDAIEIHRISLENEKHSHCIPLAISCEKWCGGERSTKTKTKKQHWLCYSYSRTRTTTATTTHHHHHHHRER